MRIIINGRDELSIKALNLLKLGNSVKYISENLGITLDQAKKLSQLNRMQEQIQEIPDALQDKLKALGFKALVLNKLLKENDIEGLQDILQCVDGNTKRDRLTTMLLALDEKRKHIDESKKQIKYQMRELEYKEKEINRKIQELHTVEFQLGEIFNFLKDVNQETRDFLMEHLGVKERNIVLTKRLYYNWQQELKRDSIIEYDDMSYSWQVKDIDRLITGTEKKLSNKRSRQCMYFDPKSDPWNSSAEYKKVTGADANLTKLLKDNQDEIKTLNKERKKLLKSIQYIKSKSAMSYMEAAILSNEVSLKDIETHALLQDKGMKWLYENENVCATELSMGNYRFDVIGYDVNNCITIIEAKASKEDFKRDIKWQNYLKYCHKFYFIFNEDEIYYIKNDLIKKLKGMSAGILVVSNNTVKLIEECMERSVIEEKENLIFNTARASSKKIIYGY